MPKIKIFLDSASPEEIINFYEKNKKLIAGFTTNPTLMRNAGIKNYLGFVLDLVKEIKDLPISFEVFADDIDLMKKQAITLASIASNIAVKIPITNTVGTNTSSLISELNAEGILCNVTALMTLDQVKKIVEPLESKNPLLISIFAGRIADTGRNPEPILASICEYVKPFSNISIIWASTRELINIFQAEKVGCNIITVTEPLLRKMQFIGKDLDNLSLETVKMFHHDAKLSGYTI